MSEVAARAVPLRSLFGIPMPAPPEPPPDIDLIRAEGFAAGLAEGRREAAGQLADMADHHAAALLAAEASAAALLDAVGDDLAGLALAIARQVLAAEPAIGQETVSALVREVLAAVPGEAGGRLLLGSGMPLPDGLPAGWEVETDARLPAGEVQAHLPPRAMHAALGRRLDRLAEAMGLGA
jgi:flagellar assembly protein FliH